MEEIESSSRCIDLQTKNIIHLRVCQLMDLPGKADAPFNQGAIILGETIGHGMKE
jgi:hypothetical protein